MNQILEEHIHSTKEGEHESKPKVKGRKRSRLSIFPMFTSHSKEKNTSTEVLRLTEDSLQKSVKSGVVSELFGAAWANRIEIARIRSLYFSILINALFFLHAPVSQKFFNYFSCRNVGGREFLRVDFSLECGRGRHADFMWVVISGMVIFTFGLPIYIIIKFCKYRKHLHSPFILHRYGFLYSNFVKGAEFWELHELARKILLIGFLVFLKSATLKATIATIICVGACCSLNYVRPHKEPAIIVVDQASFFLTTLKYLILVLTDTRAFQNGEESEWVGIVLLGLDAVFLCIAFLIGIGVIAALFGHAVTSAVGDAVGTRVESTVGDTIGPLATLGYAVSDAVGIGVGSAVGV